MSSNYEKLRNNLDDDLPLNVSLKTLFSHKTLYNADSVEWCPHDNFKNVFVCGNYQYIPETECESKQRIGRILLFSIEVSTGLKLEQEIETGAVLDQKWCHEKINDAILLGVANSNSEVEIYELKKGLNDKITLEKLCSYIFPCEDDELLILSLDWSNNKLTSQEPEIVCSDSHGGVHILKLTEDRLIRKSSVLKFHQYEAWIAAFYYWDSNVFFSGGDDYILYKYDQRTGSEPVSINRSHEAGVTSLHSNSNREFILASGSYDERVRLWDIRNFKSPLSVVKTPGPIWRVKWDPFSKNHMLVASMLGGVHVISALNLEKLSIVDSYYDHENIAYGVDWSFLSEDEVNKYSKGDNMIIASCSFYDNLLCVSKLKCEI